MPLLAILGRQPAIGLAELESIVGADPITRIRPSVVALNVEPERLIFDNLGGVTKLAKLLIRLPNSDLQQAVEYIKQNIASYLSDVPEGKIQFGLSVYGFPVNPRKLNAHGLEIKKAIKADGRSVRIVPNDSEDLNAAKILYNRLTGPTGMELIIVKDGKDTFLGQTLWVQNIESYAKRDHGRPKRDARVGMLPPKLAQIILHLAQFDSSKCVLDPFCGTGVILQEALLMGGSAIGTDIEPRMIEYTEKNLKWFDLLDYKLSVGDATKYTWEPSFDCIASETYLGRPLASLPAPQELEKIIQTVNVIIKKFLQNVAQQTKPGFKLCIAVPAWHAKSHFKHLPLLDHLTDLGYNRVSFVHAKNSELIYYRNDQIVGRELVVLERI